MDDGITQAEMLPDSSKWVEKSGKGVEQVRGHIALYDQCTMGCEIKYSTIFMVSPFEGASIW